MKQILKWYLFGFLLSLITFSVSLTGCEKPIDDIVVPPTDEEGLVPVSLTLGFTEETGSYTPAPGSRSGLPLRAPAPGSPRRRQCLLRGETRTSRQYTYFLTRAGWLIQSGNSAV